MAKFIGHRGQLVVVLVGLVLGLASLAEAKVSINKGALGTTYDVTVDGIDWQDLTLDQKGFVRPVLQGVKGYEGVLFKEGAPAIPVVRFYVDGEVKITAAEPAANKISSPKHLVPNQPSVAKRPGATALFTMDSEKYQSSEFYPSQPYEVTPAGSVRGVTRSLVSLYPLAYSAATKEFRFRGAFRVEANKGFAPKETVRDFFAFVVGSQYVGSPSLAAYAASKRDLGYEVRYINVGTDANTPDEIRAKLQVLFRETNGGLKYALLIGDVEDVPSRSSTIISGVTDHFYRAIDTDDYATDINGPDIGVGRISVKTEEQLAVVFAKYAKYQQGQFASEAWLKKAAFLATDDRYEVAEGTHNYVIQSYTTPKGYTGQFPTVDIAGGDELYAITHRATKADVVAALQEGRTIVDYSGHGATTFWAGPELQQADVRSLQNESALPFVVSNACITGDFRVDESFAETWQRSATGAVAFWGSMDSSYWDEDDILERATFDAVYRDKVLNFNQLTNYGLGENWKHYGGAGKSAYYWETYHFFGDPSLLLRTDLTKAIAIEGPEVLPLGVSQSGYSVTDGNGQPVEGARVGIVNQDGSFSSAALTDANGAVNFNMASVSNTAAVFKITVYGANTKLVTKELKLVPSNQPYLSLSGFTTNGRGLAVAHLGETLNLGFEVKNLGMVGTAGGQVQAVLRSGPAILLTRGAVNVPAIAPNATAQLRGGSIAFAVLADAVSDERIIFDLNWTTAEGVAGKSLISLRVVRAGLAVTAVDFGVEGQPEEGGIRPGDSGPVFLTLQNTGTENLTGGILRATGSGCATTIQGDVEINALAPGQKIRLLQPLTVTSDAQCANGGAAAISLAGDYQSLVQRPVLQALASFKVGVMRTEKVTASAIGLAIPDNGPAVEKMVTFSNEGVINQVGVRVNITHTYIGDLTVELVHPDGTRVILVNKEGGSTHDIARTFGLDGDPLPALNALAGKAAAGEWKISAKDSSSQDTGTLQEVELVVRGYMN